MVIALEADWLKRSRALEPMPGNKDSSCRPNFLCSLTNCENASCSVQRLTLALALNFEHVTNMFSICHHCIVCMCIREEEWKRREASRRNVSTYLGQQHKQQEWRLLWPWPQTKRGSVWRSFWSSFWANIWRGLLGWVVDGEANTLGWFEAPWQPKQMQINHIMLAKVGKNKEIH